MTFAFPVICTHEFSSGSFFCLVTLEKYDELAVSFGLCVIAKDVDRNVVRRNGAATCMCIIIIIKKSLGCNTNPTCFLLDYFVKAIFSNHCHLPYISITMTSCTGTEEIENSLLEVCSACAPGCNLPFCSVLKLF